MKRTIAALLIAAAALPLVAMGGSESGVETVTVWHSNSGKAGAAFDQIVEDFNATIGKEKGIEIEPVYQGLANDVLTKVKAAASADLSSLPDIAQMDATSCLDMMNADYLITIDELGFDTSILLPQAVEAFSSYKGLLGLPFSCSLLLAYYDKTLFDSLGLEPPRTLDELTGIAPLIGAKDSSGKVTRYAMAGVPTTYELGAFIGAQEGLSYFVDNENGHAGTPTEVLFGKEGTFRNFLEYWKKLADTGYLNSIGSGTTTEFAAGRTAMILASSSSLTRILADVSGRFEVGTAFVPMTDEDATGGVNIGGDALFCFSGSDAVKTVLGYLTSPDVQMMWAKETGYIAVNTGIYDDPDYIGFLKENPAYSKAVEEMHASNPKVVGIWLPSAYQIYYSFQSNVMDVAEGNKSIDQAVDDMVATVQDALDTYAAANID